MGEQQDGKEIVISCLYFHQLTLVTFPEGISFNSYNNPL